MIHCSFGVTIGARASIQEDLSIPNSIRFIFAAILVGAGFYCLTIAFYNVSMSALETFASVLGTLAVLFWSFIVLAVVLIAAGSTLFAATIRKINREDRKLSGQV